MEGKMPRQIPIIEMIDAMVENDYAEMKKKAENRDAWRCWVLRTWRKAGND